MIQPQISTSEVADAGTFWVRRELDGNDRQDLLPYAAEVIINLDALDRRQVDVRDLTAELQEFMGKAVIVRVTTTIGGKVAQATVVETLTQS